eukprot:GHVU01112576.1.p1 GENE.GHVU01112576.1~~GHVU01112576.1.p1  ORF type:complete len:119 (-),score=11.70 GHVU01112576.1:809-1165(-)
MMMNPPTVRSKTYVQAWTIYCQLMAGKNKVMVNPEQSINGLIRLNVGQRPTPLARRKTAASPGHPTETPPNLNRRSLQQKPPRMAKKDESWGRILMHTLETQNQHNRMTLQLQRRSKR